MNILIVANAFHLVSGGDKIFVEYGKRWSNVRGVHVRVITNGKGRQFCLEHGMDPTLISTWWGSESDAWGPLVSSVVKSAVSFFRALTLPTREVDVVFSASFIWPDLFPGLILKFRKPSLRWVVASYVFVVPPWKRHFVGNKLSGIFLYLVQSVSLFLLRRFADGVFVASKEDVGKFPAAIAIRGGVDYDMLAHVPQQPMIYDAVHLGRLHPQKNIPELLGIWRLVLTTLPSVRLMIAGAGPIEDILRQKVESDEKLQKSVEFLGVLDGFEKAALYKSSGIFVSATRFDSGILALDEAMACGTPGVVYDLPHFDYPKGVVKIPIGDKQAFAHAIVDFITHPKKRKQLGRAAQQFASTLSWDKKAPEALRFIRRLSCIMTP